MNTNALTAASALALATAACGPATPPARAALECPANQGDLTRIAQAADGKSCGYRAADGAEVMLELVAANGDVDGALKAIETRLLADRTAPAATDPAQPAAATAPPTNDGAAEKAAREAAADTKGVEVNVAVKVGKDERAQTVSDGDGETRVDLPGISVVANEREETARVQVGPIKIDVNGEDGSFRYRRDVRLRGEQLNPEKRGVRATFIYSGKDLPGGYRYVGYEAGGPKRGPITIAIVKAKTQNEDGEELIPDVQKLVRRNGGV